MTGFFGLRRQLEVVHIATTYHGIPDAALLCGLYSQPLEPRGVAGVSHSAIEEAMRGDDACEECARKWASYQEAQPPAPGGLLITGRWFTRHLAVCDMVVDIGGGDLPTPTWQARLSALCGEVYHTAYANAAGLPQWGGGDGWDGQGKVCGRCQAALPTDEPDETTPSLIDLLGGES